MFHCFLGNKQGICPYGWKEGPGKDKLCYYHFTKPKKFLDSKRECMKNQVRIDSNLKK